MFALTRKEHEAVITKSSCCQLLQTAPSPSLSLPVFFILGPQHSLHCRNIWVYIRLRGFASLRPSSISVTVIPVVLELDQHLLHQGRTFSLSWDHAGRRHKMQSCYSVTWQMCALSLWKEYGFARVVLHMWEDQQRRPGAWKDGNLLCWAVQRGATRDTLLSWHILTLYCQWVQTWKCGHHISRWPFHSCRSCPKQSSEDGCRGIHRAFGMVSGKHAPTGWLPWLSSVPHREAEIWLRCQIPWML